MKKIKVVIWDLDDTVWDGTLLEDGPGKVALKLGVSLAIKILDDRGILNSIASKNHASDALATLERFDLRDYFVFPEIGWGHKGGSVRKIIQSINVGKDTVAFIDDQEFEREEVLASNPWVRVYRPDEIGELLQLKEFAGSDTDEARTRRAFYQTEEARHQAMQEESGGYLAFLKQSNLRVRITTATVEQIDRIHEIIQRTNQMNFSGNRYSKPELRALLSRPQYECYLVEAEDKYGKYGYIGFAVVSLGLTPRIIDLAFSCRVHAKRVEHAVLVFLMQRAAARGARTFEVVYHVTERNAQLAPVFADLGFTEGAKHGVDTIYWRDISRELPKNDVVILY